MNLCCKLLTLVAGWAGVATAADPEMMKLVMPEASVVFEINLGKIVASPIGAAIGESIHQGIATQLKGQLTKAKPQFQQELAGLSNLDWSREVRDIVIAGGPGKSTPTLLIAKCSLDPARMQALKAFTGGATEYEGVPILSSEKPGNGVIAFLPNSIVVVGPLSGVKSAIHRRGQPSALPAALAAQVAKYGEYDIWLASTGTFSSPLGGPMAGSPAGAQAAQFMEKLAGFNGGLRLSADLDLSADVEARTEKAAAEMSQGLAWLVGSVQAQAKSAGKSGSGLEGFKYHVNGKHILVSLHVPEEQIRAGIQQMRAAQGSRVTPVGGTPPPPPGTIRVESSEGTRVIPLEPQ